MASSCLRARHALSSALRPLKTAPRASPAGRNPNFGGSHSSPHRRYASSSSSSSSSPSTDSLLVGRLRALFLGGTVAASAYVLYLYATDTRASFHRWLAPPLLRLVFPDAEDAHHAGTAGLKLLYPLNLHPRERGGAQEAAGLASRVFGTRLANPLGISAGLDKDAEIPDALFALGAAVVEVGGCTPRPQQGNPRPRVFRVPALEGMVNRYGLNSRGADAMAARLRDRVRRFAAARGLTERQVLDGEVPDADAAVPPGSLQDGRLLLVQVAKNKETDDRDVNAVARDYVYCVNRLAPYADVLVVNVSSPNTPGLRDLQAVEPLTKILSAVVDEARRTARKTKPRVMVKVSPDEDADVQIEGIVEAVWTSGVDGVIVGNTTKRREGLVPQGIELSGKEQGALMETGGFSGPAMFERTLDLVGRYRRMLDGYPLHAGEAGAAPVPSLDGMGASGKIAADAVGASAAVEQKTIFATGGITNGQQALKVLNAGASVAMVYTGLVYGGAGTVTRMKGELRDTIRDGSR